jgi:hypothetical protein
MFSSLLKRTYDNSKLIESKASFLLLSESRDIIPKR